MGKYVEAATSTPTSAEECLGPVFHAAELLFMPVRAEARGKNFREPLGKCGNFEAENFSGARNFGFRKFSAAKQ